jgi:hypothetical protein
MQQALKFFPDIGLKTVYHNYKSCFPPSCHKTEICFDRGYFTFFTEADHSRPGEKGDILKFFLLLKNSLSKNHIFVMPEWHRQNKSVHKYM